MTHICCVLSLLSRHCPWGLGTVGSQQFNGTVCSSICLFGFIFILSLNGMQCVVKFKLQKQGSFMDLRTLHWLPVKVRIQYKIACLCFQCLSRNTMLPYLSDLLHPYQPPRTLRSLDTSLLSVPRFCLETFGRRSFSVFGLTVWNSLPLSLRKIQCF